MHTLHLVSHTHWDREWYLTYQQFRLKLVRLVDNLLEILHTNDRYLHFMLDGQTIVLEDYLAVRPYREEELRRYIQEGRILIGPWYILSDEFLVSPESIVRNLLEGERTARRFGPKMMVGYTPDSFGHIGQMPQILRGAGIQTASAMRGLADEPCELVWQAPDGSGVLMAYLRNGYMNAADILSGGPQNALADAKKLRDQLVPFSASSHILFMQGTDHMEPQASTSEALAYSESGGMADRLIHSTLPAYFKAVQAELDLDRLPVIQGELRSSRRHMLLPGVLSTRMWIKQRNRACETLLEKWVEPFSTWAGWLEANDRERRPTVLRNISDVTRQAWRLLMQCHPHDSICGCSIDAVHDEMHSRFDQVEQIGEEITRQSLEAIAGGIDTTLPDQVGVCEQAVVVYNPTSGPRTDAVSAVFQEIKGLCDFDLMDEEGVTIPYQKVGMGSSELLNMAFDRKELLRMFEMVSDGVVMGWKIQDFQFHREAKTVYIQLSMTETGMANLAVWEQARRVIKEALDDATIMTYSVHARTVEASQVIFCAPDVPGCGYRTFWVRGKATEKARPERLSPLAQAVLPLASRAASTEIGRRVIGRLSSAPTGKPGDFIENEFLRVEVQADGTLDILDKATGMYYRGQNRLVDGGDRGDEYNYSPPSADQVIPARLRSVCLESGPVLQTFELDLELKVPEALAMDRKARSKKQVTLPITSRVSLIQGVPRVEIHTEVTNLACDHRLRVHFLAPFSVREGLHDGHYEVVRRPVGVPAFDAAWVEHPRPETCQRAFTALENGEVGLLVANRGLPEVEVCNRKDGNSEMALTLLRCVGWLSRDDLPERKGHAGPGLATPGAQMQGAWAFDYAVVPFRSKEILAAYRQAYSFEAPLRAVCTYLHEGSWGKSGSLLRAAPECFIISAVVPSEYGNGWLARGYNLSDQTISVRLDTFATFDKAEKVNLLEQVQETLETIEGHTVQIQVKKHEVVTIRFQ